MIVMEARTARAITLALTFMVCAGQGTSLEEHQDARRNVEARPRWSRADGEPGALRSLNALVALLECSNSAAAWQIGAYARLPIKGRPTGSCAALHPAVLMRQRGETLPLPLTEPQQKQQSGLWQRLRTQRQTLVRHRKWLTRSPWARRAASLARFAPALFVGASILSSSGPVLAAVASSAISLKKKARQLETFRTIFKWVAGVSILVVLFRQVLKEDKEEMERVKAEYARLENFKEQLIKIDESVEGDEITDAIEKLQNETTGSDAIKETLRMTKSELEAAERKGRNKYEGIDDDVYKDELGLDLEEQAPQKQMEEEPQKQMEPVKVEKKKKEKPKVFEEDDDDFFDKLSKVEKKKDEKKGKPKVADDDDDFFDSLR
mmetsp:Transcript_80740/g.140137  ORF Transcript_80740/g.140137 Transcript_80740/m.140137 type:complete len:378 (+) Transcript_80740:79-1212(+)